MSIVKSVVLSCAGVGSRLGLGQTKALIKVGGRSLLHWHLEFFREVEDLRIVVGFQAANVVEEALKLRSDIIFVYNHDYFRTHTGMSYYLGGKDSGDLVFQWDGDLLVHPDDIDLVLSQDTEFAAYSEKCSGDAVYLRLNTKGEVVSFSRENGDYEWTGPCALWRERLYPTCDGAVFNMLERTLPIRGLKIRAQDIDVYNDFKKAEEFVKSWG